MLGYHIAVNKMRTTPIIKQKMESQTVKILTVRDQICSSAKPGQFLMLWVPGVDEIPLSIMDVESDGAVSVAVKNVGDATKCLHQKHTNDLVGVRGPFGNSFSLKSKKALIVGGGTGIAPLYFLAKRLKASAASIKFVMGAKTEKELILRELVARKIGSRNLLTTTEDGSCGLRGLCTEPFEQMLNHYSFDSVFGCGPEKMIQEVFRLAQSHAISMEASLERLMRCAVGLCGSCTIGKYRVCVDGPVFGSNQLSEMTMEFGRFKRDFDGKKIHI